MSIFPNIFPSLFREISILGTHDPSSDIWVQLHEDLHVSSALLSSDSVAPLSCTLLSEVQVSVLGVSCSKRQIFIIPTSFHGSPGMAAIFYFVNDHFVI